MSYDPEKAPDPAAWLEMGEDEKSQWIVEYHSTSDQEEPEGGWELHALLHCVVENQIALQTVNVPETVSRLLRQGLCRHDAVHAIGSVVSEDIYELLKNESTFDPKKHRRRLEKLTAKRWLKGKW